jgi:hypothetical protein
MYREPGTGQLRSRRAVLADAAVGEIRLFGRVAFADEDVAGFDVTVHQARGVCLVQRTGHLLDHADRAPRLERAAFAQQRP